MMALEYVQRLAQRQATALNANLIMTSVMLRYSAEEFEQAIAREIRENPALVAEERAHCLRCGSNLRMGVCPKCDHISHATTSRDDWGEPSRSATTEDDDPLSLTPSGMTLPVRLLPQVRASLPSSYGPIAEYLVGSLDSRGYLAVSVAEVAEALAVTPYQVEEAIAALQTMDPPGIGARTLRECLLLQLAAFEEQGIAPTVVRLLIEEHLDELGRRNFTEIAHALGSTSAEVEHGLHFIRTNLNPYPAHQFEPGDVPGRPLEGQAAPALFIFPDVIIRHGASGFSAEIVERRRYRLTVEPLYIVLSRQTETQAQPLLDPPAYDHVRHYLRRTQFFLQGVEQRWQTLARITAKLIELQSDFFAHGVRYLRPLTRGDLGAALGMHESTISRAMAEKYVLLPTGKTMAFADFFDESLAAKDVLKDLVAREDREHPFSDEDLVRLLGAYGHHLARRTAAKYREALGIPPARSRAHLS